ncbi:hypothetical protein J6524_04805 [Bradyrhizobium sp. WSM 1738]|uniref:hypothetical protein n=1 Tax=Bradyrhizobium hereditatis TaxID=2821405 RepID=UPI001CE28EFA|nr:hypothetical protein [Bradyrhizobium hereditatis]MCA6114249.1 hypothetical protein [Bradyrhizobium hereditatis]
MATNTKGTSARQYREQQVHYLRFLVNYNDAGIAAGVKKQTLPKGAIIVGTDVHNATAFNAGTTNVLTVGGGTNFNEIVAAGDVDETATGLTQNIKPTSTFLGPLAADTDVYVKYTQTGTAATAGKATVIVKYVVDNDL